MQFGFLGALVFAFNLVVVVVASVAVVVVVVVVVEVWRLTVANILWLVSHRSQMISTLRDELTQRCDEIIELEAALSSLNQQVKITAV